MIKTGPTMGPVFSFWLIQQEVDIEQLASSGGRKVFPLSNPAAPSVRRIEWLCLELRGSIPPR
jgi:hypothetical protein